MWNRNKHNKNATLYFWRWFCSLQLEPAIQNYMNRKIETFKTLVQVMHRKLVLVKMESSVIEISENVHWSRRCYYIFYKRLKWSFPKTLVQHITLERYGRVRIEVKLLYPCFIAVIKHGYEFGCVWIKSRVRLHEWFNYTQHNEKAITTLNAIIHGYRCFIS